MKYTLEFQINHTVGKNLHPWKTIICIGFRATEMCPNIQAIDIWLSALKTYDLSNAAANFQCVNSFPLCGLFGTREYVQLSTNLVEYLVIATFSIKSTNP